MSRGTIRISIEESSSRSDATSFGKVLAAIKDGRNIDASSISQFDERTEESSAQQYFQVEHRTIAQSSLFIQSDLVLRLSVPTTEYDARLHSNIDLPTRHSRQFHRLRWKSSFSDLRASLWVSALSFRLSSMSVQVQESSPSSLPKPVHVKSTRSKRVPWLNMPK